MTEKQECEHGQKYRVNCITCYGKWNHEQGKQEGIRIGLEKAVEILELEYDLFCSNEKIDEHQMIREIQSKLYKLKSALSESEKK